MATDGLFERINAEVFEMSLSEVKYRLLHFDPAVRLDFSAEYLEKLDGTRLRHLLAAALLTLYQKKGKN